MTNGTTSRSGPVRRVMAVVVLAAACAGAGAEGGGCWQEEPRQEPPRRRAAFFDVSPQPTPTPNATAGVPASQPVGPPRAITPSQALAVLGGYLAESKFDALYDEFLSEPQKQKLTRDEFRTRIQDNYYPLVRLLQRLVNEDSQYRQVLFSSDRRQVGISLQPQFRPKKAGELWGVGFRMERQSWKLDQFRPEILVPLEP